MVKGNTGTEGNKWLWIWGCSCSQLPFTHGQTSHFVDKPMPGVQRHWKLPPSLQPAQGRGKVSHTCTVPNPSLPSVERFLVTLCPQKISHIHLFKEERLEVWVITLSLFPFSLSVSLCLSVSLSKNGESIDCPCGDVREVAIVTLGTKVELWNYCIAPNAWSKFLIPVHQVMLTDLNLSWNLTPCVS